MIWYTDLGTLYFINSDFWDISKCRNVAEDLLKAFDQNNIAYGAYYKDELVGFLYLGNKLFGKYNQYIELLMLHVSEPFRKMGIGKTLFQFACNDAKLLGATKLYISANSSKESQEAYRKMGCVNAEEIIFINAENEPFDIQMEYQL